MRGVHTEAQTKVISQRDIENGDSHQRWLETILWKQKTILEGENGAQKYVRILA